MVNIHKQRRMLYQVVAILLLLTTCLQAQYLHPEDFGARALTDPRGGDIILAKQNSAAFAKMLKSVEGPASYGGNAQYALSIWLDGWYPICEEIRVAQIGVHITGKGPNYSGSGLKWIGPGREDQSVIHFCESDSSRLTSFGIWGNRELAKPMLAAIRASYSPQFGGSQRDIRIEQVTVNDPGNHSWQPGVNNAFDAALLEGGPDSINGNNDFFVVDHLMAHGCRAGIRVDHSQAVQWTIDNYKSSCDVMYESRQGGSFIGRNWWPLSRTKTVISCTGTRNDNLHIDLSGFDCEYMQSDALVDVSSSISGRLAGRALQTSGTKVDRDFYLLRMRDYAACRFVFQDLLLLTSSAYGPGKVRHCVQLGPDAYSNVDYRLAFESCHFTESVSLLQNAGWVPRRVHLRVDEKRVVVVDTKIKDPTISELTK